jgi:O-methyltransferase
MDDRTMAKIIADVRPYSMVSDDALRFSIESAIKTIAAGRTGDIVECGTWRGGASFAMLLAQRHEWGRVQRPVWLMDSFQGLPPADNRDGPLALKWQSETESPLYFDNCSARLEDVKATAERFGFSPEEAVIVPGWFEQTIPAQQGRLAARGICLLRIDCDWYAPVRLVLDHLAPLVTDDGIIILDDYYAWDGCTRATHDYLSAAGLAYRIRSLPSFHGAWIIKRDARESPDAL